MKSNKKSGFGLIKKGAKLYSIMHLKCPRCFSTSNSLYPKFKFAITGMSFVIPDLSVKLILSFMAIKCLYLYNKHNMLLLYLWCKKGC